MNKIKKLICFCCVCILTFSLVACDSNTSENLSKDDLSNIKFKNFSKEVSSDNIYKDIEKLSSKDNSRMAGYSGESETADYISKKFEDMGLTVEKQEFPLCVFENNKAELKLTSPEEKIIESKVLQFSKATPSDGISAEVVVADSGNYTDLKKIDIKDKIVLIPDKAIMFKEATSNASSFGAAAVIFYVENSEYGTEIPPGTLRDKSTIPAFMIHADDAKYLKSLAESGQSPKVSMVADCECKDTTSKNIIGTLKSKKEGAKTLIVGAHYDGVDTPAANDNGSGISTILEVARVLSKKDFNCNIKFIAFGAEEVGLLGSSHYTSSMSQNEFDDIIAMINADMVGVGDSICVYTMDEEKSLTADLAESCINYLGFENRRDISTRSDHAPFDYCGVPVAFFEYGPDTNYHTDEDTIDKISKENLETIANIITSLTNEIGKNPARFEK